MKKHIIHTWSIIGCIITIIFNVVFFILTSDDAIIGRSVTTWISYGFIHVALLFLIFAPAFINKGRSSRDTATSVLIICVVYCLIELTLGMLFIFLTSSVAVESNRFFEILHSNPNKFGIITQTILFGLFIITIITLVVINRDTEEKETRQEQELQFIKTAGMHLKLRIQEINDNEIAYKLGHLYDYIRTSPIKSTADIQKIECEIMEDIQEIMKTNDKERITQLIDNALSLTKQRNMELSLKNRQL